MGARTPPVFRHRVSTSHCDLVCLSLSLDWLVIVPFSTPVAVMAVTAVTHRRFSSTPSFATVTCTGDVYRLRPRATTRRQHKNLLLLLLLPPFFLSLSLHHLLTTRFLFSLLAHQLPAVSIRLPSIIYPPFFFLTFFVRPPPPCPRSNPVAKLLFQHLLFFPWSLFLFLFFACYSLVNLFDSLFWILFVFNQIFSSFYDIT